MEVEKEKNSDQQKSDDTKKLLRRLREQLHSSNGSIRRQAGFNLSWLQEDGMEVLEDALLGNSAITTKNAAAYGLRKVHGRMKKKALEIFKQGQEHEQSSTRDVCTKALILLGEMAPTKTRAKKAPVGKLRINEIPAKTKPKRRISLDAPTLTPSRQAQLRNRRSVKK